ncbi:MAG TPA: alcohol dehydrogenase catalytic domain-containing protein [Mycobacteriales bacterium]|jgi:NADPH:quinone reductase-like Zn-dependent oxidoreductase
MTQRAAGVARTDGPVTALELPSPRELRDDEVLVDVRAAGVGDWDEIMRTDGWPSELQPPHALGVEAAGVVGAVSGPELESWLGRPVLTHVYPFRDGAAWAEHLVVPVGWIAEKPAALDWPEAAVFPVPALTAMQAVEALDSSAGSTVFVHGAGGVTGGWIATALAHAGARVVATAGGSASRLAAAGVAEVVDRRDPDWGRAAQSAAGEPIRFAINATPGGMAAVRDLMSPGGRFVSIAGDSPDDDILIVRPDAGQLAQALALQAAGALALPPVTTFALADADAALQHVLAKSGGAAALLV